MAIRTQGGRAPEIAPRPSDRRIEAILECWQIDDEWWRSSISRLYYEVVLEGGGTRVVYRDLTSGTWHLQ